VKQVVGVVGNGSRLRVRWRIFAFLFGFAFLGYVQRSGITVASEPMMRDLGLSQSMLGWSLTAFLIGYSVFQIPSAVIGEFWGPRRTFTAIGIITVIACLATPLMPRLAPATSVGALLILAQLLLGVAQAALFPVATGTIRNWFPTRNWGFAQGLLTTAIWIGSAVTPPLVSTVMVAHGWRVALAAASLPALLLVIGWHSYARDRPAEHRSVRAPELAELAADGAAADVGRVTLARIARLLLKPQIQLLTLSYFSMNNVFYLVTFWAFIYLRQARHLTLLESGWLASLPFLTAALACGLGGRLSDGAIARFGLRRGMRLLPLAALPCSALFLCATGLAGNAYVAVFALCAAFGSCELTEGSYWSATMRAVPEDSMTATAVLNTGGNLGGLVATPLIAALSVHQRWGTVFAIGAVMASSAALFWLWIKIGPADPHTQETLT
jgi:sugar phosphate permease